MSLSANAALREGRLALRAGNLEAAAERFGAAIAGNPKAALPWVLQAEAFYRLGRTREVIASATRAVQLDAGAIPAWTRLGAVHLKLGDRQESARNFENALDVDPVRAEEWQRRLSGRRNEDSSGIFGIPNPAAIPAGLLLATVGRDLALEDQTGEDHIQERRARDEEAPPVWQVGDFIRGRHEVLAIRRGGMAFVHICFDHLQGRPSAIKSLKQDVLDSKGVREAFLREAELWVSMDRHPHIVEAEIGRASCRERV